MDTMSEVQIYTKRRLALTAIQLLGQLNPTRLDLIFSTNRSIISESAVRALLNRGDANGVPLSFFIAQKAGFVVNLLEEMPEGYELTQAEAACILGSTAIENIIRQDRIAAKSLALAMLDLLAGGWQIAGLTEEELLNYQAPCTAVLCRCENAIRYRNIVMVHQYLPYVSVDARRIDAEVLFDFLHVNQLGSLYNIFQAEKIIAQTTQILSSAATNELAHVQNAVMRFG